MNLCTFPFLIMCYLARFAAKVNSTAHHSTEERGGVSRAHNNTALILQTGGSALGSVIMHAG